jgi:hypothetical protein
LLEHHRLGVPQMERTARELGYPLGQNVLYRLFQSEAKRLDRDTVAAIIGATEHLTRQRVYPEDVLEVRRPQQPEVEGWLARGGAFRLLALTPSGYQIDRLQPHEGWATFYVDTEAAARRSLQTHLRRASELNESIELSTAGLKLLRLDHDPDELTLQRS